MVLSHLRHQKCFVLLNIKSLVLMKRLVVVLVVSQRPGAGQVVTGQDERKIDFTFKTDHR